MISNKKIMMIHKVCMILFGIRFEIKGAPNNFLFSNSMKKN